MTVKLNYLEQWTEARRYNAEMYSQYLLDMGLKLPISPDYSSHVYHLYVIQVKNRVEVQEQLRQNEIATGVHYPKILPMLAAYAYLGHKSEDFPVSTNYTPNILSIPMYPELREEQIIKVSKVLQESLDN